jgi:hypothetical protein
MSDIAPLPDAPEQAYHPATYRGRVGRYAGQLHEVRWGYYKGWAHGQIRRAFVRKRWFQVVVPTEHLTLIVRLQDDGTTGHGRVLVLDRTHGGGPVHVHGTGAPLRTLVVGPMAGEGTDAFLRTEPHRIELTRDLGEDAWQLSVDVDGLKLDATLGSETAPTPSLVIGEARDPFRHRPGLTQRAPLLHVTGQGTLHGVPWVLDGVGSVTYTNVFLPPSVTGRLLSAEGDGLALAVSDGDLLGDTQEATLWVDGRPHGLPRVHLLHDDPQGPWRAVSGDGRVKLRFAPQTRQRAVADRRFGRVHHDSCWMAGQLTGTVPGPSGPLEVDLPALAEVHRIRG